MSVHYFIQKILKSDQAAERTSQQALLGFRERPQIFCFPSATFSIFLCSYIKQKKKIRQKSWENVFREMNDGVL